MRARSPISHAAGATAVALVLGLAAGGARAEQAAGPRLDTAALSTPVQHPDAIAPAPPAPVAPEPSALDRTPTSSIDPKTDADLRSTTPTPSEAAVAPASTPVQANVDIKTDDKGLGTETFEQLIQPVLRSFAHDWAFVRQSIECTGKHAVVLKQQCDLADFLLRW